MQQLRSTKYEKLGICCLYWWNGCKKKNATQTEDVIAALDSATDQN